MKLVVINLFAAMLALLLSVSSYAQIRVIDGKDNWGMNCQLFVDTSGVFKEVGFKRFLSHTFWVQFDSDSNGVQREESIMQHSSDEWGPYSGAAITFFGWGLRRIHYKLEFESPSADEVANLSNIKFKSYKVRVTGDWLKLPKMKYECKLDPSTERIE